MKAINTIKGQVYADDVGLICPHEHLFLDMTYEAIEPQSQEEKALFTSEIKMEHLGVLRRNPYVLRTNLILDDVEDAISESECLLKYGCNLLLDLTSKGLGRDIKKLKEVSDRTELNIVAGCGLFVHDTISAEYESKTSEELAKWMIDEIQNGIDGTDIKAGVIGEIGVSERIYPIEERSLKAAAMANIKTGLPVFVHTYPWSRAGLEAIEILLSSGVKASDICICHLDVTFDYEYIKLALDKGIYLEFDNIGKEFYFDAQDGAFSGGPFETDIARARMLKRLVAEGHADRLLVANDLCLKTMLHKYGGWGYDHIYKNFIPMLRMEGLEEETIKQVINTNPRTFLFGQ